MATNTIRGAVAGTAREALIGKTALQLVCEGGAILLKHFGKIKDIRQKEHPSSVVCEADLASEEHIVTKIRARFPHDSIVAEESGYRRGSSEFTWVIDPLDGTSNFVAGVPWFGTQLGVLKGSSPVFAAMYLPVEGTLYYAAAAHGAFRNRKRLAANPETRLGNVLCAFGFDARSGPAQTRRNADLLMRVASGVRNTRATNSLVDFCYTLDGRFGGSINLNCKIWDIVPISLMLPEAGGVFTDLQGDPIEFKLDERTVRRSYRVLGASKALHPELLALCRGSVKTLKC
ncbi:MAG TPA: inositol monophosphatase [Verrucomicrobiae bacterium]